MNTLKAEKRDMTVKAKKLRREGFVTGNVFGKEMKETVPIKIVKADVERLIKTKRKGSQIMLDVEGQQYDVLIKEIQYNAIKGQIDEIDFQALVQGEKVHSVAEVTLINSDKAVGGFLQLNLEEIAYKATPDALVESVEIDVAKLRVGDVIKVKDLPIASDPKVELTTSPDAVVLTLSEVHANAEESQDDETAAE